MSDYRYVQRLRGAFSVGHEDPRESNLPRPRDFGSGQIPHRKYRR